MAVHLSNPVLVAGDEEGIHASRVVTSLIGSRVLITRAAVGLAVLVLGWTTLAGRTYTTRSSFIPEDRRQGSNLSGLAAQLGVQVGGSDLSQSPQFYADLITSDEILRRASMSLYPADGSTTATAPLAVALGIGGADSTASLTRSMAWLRKHVAASVQAKTGIVDVAVTAKSAAMSSAINARLLALVNEFNLQTRQTQAAAERTFAEGRAAELKSELRDAEDALTTFLQRNRGDYRNAPDLAFQQERLSREVQLRQQVYTSMVQAYEQARLDAVRDTPLITILDRPRAPMRADGRGFIWKFVFALFVGALIGCGWVLARDGVHGALEGRAEREELLRALRELATDARRPWRLVV